VYFHITQQNRWEVVDGDLSDYFTTIPHGPLMKCVARRVADGTVLSVLKQWLTVPVCERAGRGRLIRTTEARDQKRGTPQGGTVTPLTQKVTLRVRGRFRAAIGWRRSIRRGRSGDRDAAADNDVIVANEDVLDDEAHDSLALHDVKRIGGAAQSCEERRESLCQAQEHGTVGGLVGDCLHLGAQRLLSLA
jgi:retron-type reverse transcriptase